MRKARVLLLDVMDTGKFQIVTCGSLDDYYRYLKCETLDITSREIGGKRYDIFCDDIGLFRDIIISSAFSSDLKPALVGNLIFANHNSAGDTTSLSDEDIQHIKNNSTIVGDLDNGKAWMAVCLD